MSNQELRQRRSRNNPENNEDKKRREELALQKMVNAIREPKQDPKLDVDDKLSDAREVRYNSIVSRVEDEWWLI